MASSVSTTVGAVKVGDYVVFPVIISGLDSGWEKRCHLDFIEFANFSDSSRVQYIGLFFVWVKETRIGLVKFNENVFCAVEFRKLQVWNFSAGEHTLFWEKC